MKKNVGLYLILPALLIVNITPLAYAEQEIKAPRPSSNLVVGNNPLIADCLMLCCSSTTGCCEMTIDLVEELEAFAADSFMDTWTILQEITNNTISCTDLFITITDLTTTLTECCNTTVSLITDINVTFSNNFITTWTILSDVSDTLTICCADTFTLITDIQDTLTACCGLTATTIEEVRATVSGDFISTWTILDDLSDILATCCADTFTLVEEINTTVTECCALTYSNLVDLLGTVSADFSGTWTILGTLTQAGCNRETLFSAQTITVPGSYCLGTNIAGVITIASDDVSLDLNGYTISGGANGIVVNAGVRGITINNGQISDVSGEGILLNDGTSAVVLKDLTLFNCGTAGSAFAIQVAGAGTRVQGCQLSNIFIQVAPGGISLINTDNSLLKDCTITECANTVGSTRGIEISSTGIAGVSLEITNCRISGISSPIGNSADGIFVNNLDGLVCKNCTIQDISTSFGGTGMFVQGSLNVTIAGCTVHNITANVAIGIWVNSSSSNYTIRECDISTLSSNVGGSTRAVYISDSTGGLVENVACVGLATTGGEATGIGTLDSTGLVIRDSACVDITGLGGTSIAAGISLSGDSMSVDSCLVTGVNSIAQSYGIEAGNSTDATHVICTNCQVQDLLASGATGVAYGYALLSGVEAMACQRCIAESISVVDGIGATSAGFFVAANALRIDLEYCRVVTVTATNGQGFDLAIGTAAVIDGAVLRDCFAQYIGDNGIRIRATVKNAVVENCQVDKSDTGILNLGTNTKFINCISSNNTTAVGGVAPTSILGTGVYSAGATIIA